MPRKLCWKVNSNSFLHWILPWCFTNDWKQPQIEMLSYRKVSLAESSPMSRQFSSMLFYDLIGHFVAGMTNGNSTEKVLHI